MINNKKQFKSQVLTSVLVSLLLVGCSQSSSSDSNEVQQDVQPEVDVVSTTDVTEVVDYSPQVEKLDVKASDSTELYVEPDFQFDTYKTVTFDLQVSSYEGEPLTNTILFLSAIEVGVESLDDPRLANKSLIAVMKTDESGSVYKQIEVDQNVANVLIEINAIGTENEVILPLTETLLIQQKL